MVEDDPSLREAIERLLGAAGVERAAFGSAEELLASGAADDGVCLVSDLRLPAMSGLELLAELGRRNVRLPLILITAHDAPGLREEALARGAAAYLVKPFTGSTLLEAIRDATGRTRPHAPAGPAGW